MTRLAWEWKCESCGQIVTPGSGYLCVDVLAASTAEEAHRRSQTRDDDRGLQTRPWREVSEELGQLPAMARWRCFHDRCREPNPAEYDINLRDLEDLAELLDWFAHLHAKRWLDGTNWFELWRSMGAQKMPAAPEPALIADPHELYRFWDAGGALLYVGITNDYARRLREHRKQSSWYGKVAKKATVLCASRDEALRLEAAAIRDERPLHNKQGQVAV